MSASGEAVLPWQFVSDATRKPMDQTMTAPSLSTGRRCAPSRLRALVMLAGSVSPGRMLQRIGRSLFELPLEKNCTILDGWCREAVEVAGNFGLPTLPVRVLIDRGSPEPATPAGPSAELSPVTIERDPRELRGTGGVLRDISTGYDDDDVLIVANAAAVPMLPLREVVEALLATDGDVSIVSHQDGAPSGIMVLRCGVLRLLAEVGFVDLKEQGLPAIAAAHRVTVVRYARATSVPVRTTAGYIAALRRHHLRLRGVDDAADPYAEEWESAFSIVEDGASVDAGARLHDTVVLRGGRVGAGAVVVQSLICPGGVVRRGATVVDELVWPGGAGGGE